MQPGATGHMWGVFLWAVFSAFIVGVFIWSTAILLQQKRAWAAFAAKNGLTYTAGSLFGSPSASGRMGNFKISFFTDVQKTSDVRRQRMVTVIETEMGPVMPVPGALATKEYAEFIAQLALSETFDPGFPEWRADYVLKTRDAGKLKPYLTQERAKTLGGIFSMKNSVALFFFDTHEAVLRIETPDPLRDAVHMEKITKRIIDAMDRLRPTDDERKRWGSSAQPT